MLDAYANMVAAAEKALDIFMQDLPYNYRDQPISQQPDVVWGEHVLPNFRSTLEGLHISYSRLLKGEKEALGKSQVIAGWNKEKTIQALNGYKDGTYGGVMKNIMKGQVATKTDLEIDALASFISNL